MILYHGSNIDIEKIDLTKSKVGKDFGVGFYLTPDALVAEKQANRRADIDGGIPIVNKYIFNECALDGLKVKKFDGYSLYWAEFVMNNRANHTREQFHDFDIVIGPIADDEIGMQLRKIKSGRISIEEFMEAIKYKRITIQYFFSTEDSLNTLYKI